MCRISDYRNLEVWKKAHSLALDIYRVSGELPTSERYGLQSQMRRSAASIPENIAEGSGRSTDRDFARFLSTAIGSACELEYQLLLGLDLGYLDEDIARPAREDVSEVRRMLRALRGYLKRSGNLPMS